MPFLRGGSCGSGAGEEGAGVEGFLRGEGCETFLAELLCASTVAVLVGRVGAGGVGGGEGGCEG